MQAKILLLYAKYLFYRQAFIAVEKGYLESIGDLLAERASLQFDIPDGLTSYETYQKFPDLVSRIIKLCSYFFYVMLLQIFFAGWQAKRIELWAVSWD